MVLWVKSDTRGDESEARSGVIAPRDPSQECLLVRRTSSALLSVALVPAALVVPVLGTGAAKPHPVAAHVMTLRPALNPVAGPRALAAGASTVTGSVQATPDFSTFGASWQGSTTSSVQVRVRAAGSGSWSGWTDLDPADAGPDPRRGG